MVTKITKMLRWINKDLSGDNKKQGKKKWFSIWVLLFWIIACFPVAFVYIIVKAIQRGSTN